MGLLDDLKREAEARKAAEAERTHAEEARANAVRAAALPALFRIRRYLAELIEQMRVLKTEIGVTLPIAGIGPVAGFRQVSYDLAAEGNPPELVILRCALRLDRRAQYEVRGAGPLNPWSEGLRRHGLQAQVVKILPEGAGERAIVALEGSVPAMLQFRLDLAAGALEIVTRNFDEIGERRQLVRAPDVTERWLEEMTKYVLRQENRFLVQELSPELREYFRRRLEREKRLEQEREVPDVGSTVALRLKSLFRRQPQLVLEHRGQSQDLSGLEGDFLMGRSDACDLVVREIRVSRFHARIELRGDEFLLVDESRNGTMLRQADGRVHKLKDSAVSLQGSGLFALGSEPSEANPEAIRFSVQRRF